MIKELYRFINYCVIKAWNYFKFRRSDSEHSLTLYLSTSLCKNQAVGESEGSSDIGQTLQNGRLYCTKLPCEIIF